LAVAEPQKNSAQVFVPAIAANSAHHRRRYVLRSDPVAMTKDSTLAAAAATGGVSQSVPALATLSLNIPLRRQWIVRVCLDDGHKAAECEMER
jgi:hypothetical protein